MILVAKAHSSLDERKSFRCKNFGDVTLLSLGKTSVDTPKFDQPF